MCQLLTIVVLNLFRKYENIFWEQWDGKGCWNPDLWNTGARLSYIFKQKSLAINIQVIELVIP